MNDNCLSLCCPDNDIGVAASWQPKSMKSRSDRLVTSSTEVQYLYAGKENFICPFFHLTRFFQTAACASRKCDIFFYNGRIILLLKMKKILYLYPCSEQIRKIQRHLAVVLASVYEAMSLPTPGCFGRGACLFVCLVVSADLERTALGSRSKHLGTKMPQYAHFRSKPVSTDMTS